MMTTKNRGGLGLAVLLLIGLSMQPGCTPPGPKALLEGERLLNEGEYGEAIELLRKSTELLPDNAQAWNHLGLACHRSVLPREADDAYRKALAIDPNLASARFNLGCLWLEFNRPDEARNHFGSYVMLEPRSLEGRLLLGVAQLRAYRPAEAEKTFREILSRDGGLPEALNGLALAQIQLKKYRDASATLYTVLQTKPDYAPAVLNMAILNHSFSENWPLALQYYQTYLRLMPKPAFFEPASNAASNLEAALNAYKTPATSRTNRTNNLPLTVTNRPSLSTTGLVAAATNRTPVTPGATNVTGRTVSNLVATARTNPAVAATSTNLSATNAGTVRPQTNAIATPTNRIEQGPVVTNAAARTNHAATSVASNNLEPYLVVPRYKYLNPTKPDAGDRAKAFRLFLVAQKAQEDKRFADALLNYEAATKVDPAFFEAFARLARVALDAGDLVKAVTAYEYALAIEPESASTRFNFALALYQAGYVADAAAELERFFQKNPDDSDGRLFLANLYAQNLKQPAKAREHYQKLLELKPQHPQAAAIRQWLLKNQ